MAAVPCTALYVGRVTHARLMPFVHRFTYRVFSLLIDIDELAALDRDLRFFSHNRWSLFSIHDRDHGPRDGRPLRPWIESILRGAGIDLQGGAIRLLCFPRVLGYVFNPISIWFCYDSGSSLRAILYEVSNTFGESHSYLVPVGPDPGARETLRHDCAKRFHVSPFIGMNATYHFRLTVPDDRLAIAIRQEVSSGALLVATQTGSRRAFNDRTLLALFASHPLLTFKVIGAIHWQALRLWLKGAKVNRKPAPPRETVTEVRVIRPDKHDVLRDAA